MPTTTPNLGLKKPLGNEIFNRQVYNENLDLMDQNAAKKMVLDAHLANYTQELKTVSKQSVTLPHGLSVLNAPRAAQLKPKFKGRQLVNLLGRDGNCEDAGKWGKIYGDLSLDTDKVYGNNSIKLASTAVNDYCVLFSRNIDIDPNKHYILIGNVKLTSGKNAYVRCCKIDGSISIGTTKLVTTTGGWQLSYAKITPTQLARFTQIRVDGVLAASAIGQMANFDGIRLYEITQAEYNEIDTLTPEQFAERYPYVDSFQCVQNPAVRVEGENLFNPLNYKGVGGAGVNFIDFYPTKISIKNASSQAIAVYSFKLIPNQVYTLRVKKNFKEYGAADVYANNQETFLKGTGAGELVQFTTPAQFDTIDIFFYNSVNNIPEIIFSDIMLVLGDRLPTELKPHNPSHLYLQTPLYEGETLEEIDGNWVRTKKWEKKVLDGSLPWENWTRDTGIKRVRVPIVNAVRYFGFCVKYDGKVLISQTNGDLPHPGDTFFVYDNNYVYFDINITECGWGENYTPTVDEIKAYFMGWKMHQTGLAGAPYVSGNKYWANIAKTKGGVDLTGCVDGVDYNVTTIPTTSYPEWTPYLLHYQLATPTTEVVPHEGELTLHEGENQVEVFEGVVVRELAKPYTAGNGITSINGGSPSAVTNNKALQILAVYKNKIVDFSWQKSARTSLIDIYGIGAANIMDVSKYDPTAQYSVTYQALPEEFTAPLLSVDATYDTNIKSTVDTLVDELAKVATKADVGFKSVSDHLADLAAHGGIQHKNILHNWDFRKKPVNQRGISVYSGGGYSLDRWRTTSSVMQVNIYDGFIKVSNADTGAKSFSQIIESLLPGYYALSVMLSDGSVFSATAHVNEDVALGATGKHTNAQTLIPGLSVLIGDLNGYPAFKIVIDTGKSFNIAAAKLERGKISTLSNDTPADYGEQLALCQRYATFIGYQEFRVSHIATDYLTFTIPIPVTMRLTPSLEKGSIIVMNVSSTQQSGFTLQYQARDNGIRVVTTKASHGLSDAILRINADALFSADL
ncbi:hypothetical protein [Desulforamulus aeronauticus]|uniref:Uncharacterized protein n=1 Tax=Desulforamulus aeronauticus DSM 10349 TaxID=1121421 RepID=A0A1M6VC84_9FIRM|nr:hypothetical protein [Desulforamulus aeronauticus]SHK78974.1 hypothetical protein SAMN02745123_03123 [Desulforamulus aeronauticus DSM 10349]